MTEPHEPRIAEGTGLGAELLRSAKADAPSAAAREQTALRLGLVAAGAAEAAKATAGTLFFVKLGALVVAAAVGVGVMTTRMAPSEVASRPPAIAFPPAPSSAALGAPSAEPSTSVTRPPAQVARPVPAASVAPIASEDERALIAEARSAVTRGDQVSANAALDRYAREFPKGVLSMEAGVLRVEALVRWGDAERARALAKELLAKDANGPGAERLRELLRALGP